MLGPERHSRCMVGIAAIPTINRSMGEIPMSNESNAQIPPPDS